MYSHLKCIAYVLNDNLLMAHARTYTHTRIYIYIYKRTEIDR